MLHKIKISKKDFDKMYEIEEIAGENHIASSKQDTTPTLKPEPEFLTKEEEDYDTKLFEDHNIEEET